MRSVSKADLSCGIIHSSVNTVVDFMGRQVKFSAFLHPNEHPENICLYLVRQFEAEQAKIGHIVRSFPER